MRLTKGQIIRFRQRMGRKITRQEQQTAVADLILRTSENARGVVAGKQRPKGKTIIKFGRQRLRGLIP